MGIFDAFTYSNLVEDPVIDIENKLISVGAKHITKEYTDKVLTSIFFSMDVENKTIPFKIPVNPKKIEEVQLAQIRKPTTKDIAKAKEDAERLAWSLVSEWITFQLSLISFGQVDLLQVFLPFAWNFEKNESHYELLKQNNYNELPELLGS